MHNIIQLFLIISFVFAPIIKMEAKTDYNNITFNTIPRQKSLSKTPINCIFEDSIGYLWIGSKTRLLRYDGNNLLDFPKQLVPNVKINTNKINFITYKNSNFYFLFNNRLTLFNVKNNSIKNFKDEDYFDKKNKNNLMNNCMIDKQNNIWISTEKGLYKVIKEKGEIKKFKKIIFDKKDPSIYTSGLYMDKYKNLWIGTKKGLYIYNEKENRTINLTEKLWQIQPYSVNSIKEDKKGNIWIGQTKRLVEFYNNQNILNAKEINVNIYLFPDGNSFNYIDDFDFDVNGNIWLIKPHMINILEFKNNSYKIHNITYNSNIKNGLSSNNFNSIHINSHGLVFIGTKEGEVNIFNPYNKSFKNIKPSKYTSKFKINTVCKDYKNNIWLSVNYNKLFYYITKEDKFIEIKLNRDFHIKNIIETKSHEIFFSSMNNDSNKGGLFRLNNVKRFQKTHNPKDISLTLFNSTNIKGFNKESNSCFHIIQDIDNTFWYVAVKHGLYHLKYDGKNISIINFFSQDYFNKKGLNNTFISNINILSDSSLIISSTCDKIINYNRVNNSFEELEYVNKGVNIEKVTDFTFSYLDQKGKLWIGTEGNGLLRYNKENSTFKIFNKENGLNSDNVYSYMVDYQERIWINTSLGISVIDSNDNVFNVNQNKDKSISSNNLHTLTKFNDSTFYIGSNDGLLYINTKEIINHIDTLDFKIGINKIFVNGNPLGKVNDNITPLNYDYINRITLKSRQKNIDISFTPLSFSNTKNNSIKYRLLPLQSEWKNKDYYNKNFIINNLKNGNYKLECKSINKDGKASNITKSINLTIEKALYQKWWFILSVFIFIIITAIIIHKIFKRNIRNKNIRLKKLIQNQTIKLLKNNKKLEEKSKELSSINKTKTKIFSVIAHDLIGPLGTIVTTNNLLTENYDDFKENNMLKNFIASNSQSLSSLYELLQNLLFWSKHQQSSINLNPINFNLNELCQDIVNLLKFTLQSKGNILNLNIPEKLNLYADRQMIHTILRNIISNSNKFTNNGKITVTATEIKNYIQIKIKDTGIGMSMEKANNLFSDDKIESTKGTSGESGTGLGLKVSKDFVLKHKGNIFAESIENEGTTITFTISKNI